ncbi:MAG: acyltransferase [Candidatus Eremiobacteraeota bacterium]|nr:acyltransferase [Candidatus Eremiobacteraeota bacterium]
MVDRTSLETAPKRREDTAYFFGVRGLTALVIMIFHCDVMIWYLPHRVLPALYGALTSWLRYGDFRVVPFFVISGYLLTLPATRAADWPLRRGLSGFFSRRLERVVFPYYIALAVSLVFFVVWREYVGIPVHLGPLAAGTLAHLLLIHNLSARTALYINDTLWTVGLEVQCYVLMALVFFPLMRRTGAWAPGAVVAAAAAIGFALPAVFGHTVDSTRPWFAVVFALGMAAAALENRAFPVFARVERAVPWGAIWIVFALVGIGLTILEGPDPPYWRCWPSVMAFGVSFTSLVIYLRGARRGLPAGLARPLVALLETKPLAFLGRFSYSIYLTHFPIYRLLLAIVAARTDSVWVQGALGLFVFTPLCLAFAYGFHVWFERPFQKASPQLAPAVAAA